MAPFKMPFSSRRTAPNSNVETVNDENTLPHAIGGPYKPSLALGVKEKRGEPNEFKLSSVNDSGEYLPPSPTEKKSYWSKSPNLTSANHRSALNDSEPFSISRESFESYRRSFDISGRSPITHSDSYTSRTSFDSRLSRLPPRSSLSNDTFADNSNRPADDFEDVGLSDDTANKTAKKKGFLSRFSDSHDDNSGSASDGKLHHFSLLSGRRRGQSGSGSELNSVERPGSKGKADVAVR